jgi:hypothetical protein
MIKYNLQSTWLPLDFTIMRVAIMVDETTGGVHQFIATDLAFEMFCALMHEQYLFIVKFPLAVPSKKEVFVIKILKCITS